MLGLSKKKAGPIGIDLGSSSLKMIQLTMTDGVLDLVAAARTVVPDEIQGDPRGLHEWHIKKVRHLLATRGFKGRKAVTCLPSRDLLIQHLRLPKMSEENLGQALKTRAQEQIPFSVEQALLRHVVAGEVYHGGEAKLEVILMAAGDDVVRRHLDMIERTRLDIEAVNVEPYALLGGFRALMQQDQDDDSACMFVDLGHAVTKVVAAHGTQMAFGRTLSIGGRHLSADQHNADISKGGGHLEFPDSGPLASLCDDIRHCIRYHDSVFEARPVQKVIFLGGPAKDTESCRRLARAIGLPAQLGDPLARLSEQAGLAADSDLLAGNNNSEWAIAFGLALEGLHNSASMSGLGRALSNWKRKTPAAGV